MRKLLLVFLLLQIGLFAQLSNTNIWMMRGDTKTLSFNYNGNILNDSLIFVVKSSKEITAVRLISKTTYDNQINILFGVSSFVYVRLDAGDTDDLTLAKYYYDITRIHNGDSTTIFIGELNLQPDIGTPFDGTDMTGRVTTVSLANGTLNRELVWWNDSLNYWAPSGVTFSSGGSVGDADSLGGVPASEYLVKSDSTDQRTFSDAKYVDKTSTQDIPGLKNFTNTKTIFSGDSTIVKKKLIVDYALSPYKLTLSTNNITQFTYLESIISNRLENSLGLTFYGIEGSAGGFIISGSSPYSYVIHNQNGYPIHIGIGSFIHQTIDGLNSKTIFYSDSVGVRGKLKINGTVQIGNYTLPNTDGTAGQVQKSDGAGNLYWANDLYTGGVGIFNPDGSWIDTTITGEATLSAAVKDSIQKSMALYKGINNWFDYSASNEFRLGKPYNTKRFNNGAYSDVWNIDYVIPPYNLSANWLYSIEHRTDYYNDTLNTVAHSDILNVDGTGTPIWRTNDVRIMGNEIQVNVGDLPDSTALNWSLAGLTGSKVILSEANKTAGATRFPMPVRGFEFKFGSTPYYTYPRVYGFYSDLTTNTPNLETAYHFYGQGDYPSYFGGNILSDGYGSFADSITVVDGTAGVHINPSNNYGLQISRPNDDVGIKIKVDDQKTGWIVFENQDGADLGEIEFDTDGTTKTFEIGTNTAYDVILRSNTNNTVTVTDTNVVIDGYLKVDSVIVGNSTVKIFPDSITIGGTRVAKITEAGALDTSIVNNLIEANEDSSGNAIIGTYQTLDSLITDYWNGNLGSGSTFDSTYAYQRIVTLENNVSALQDSISSFRTILNSILTALDTCGCGVSIVDNTPPDPPQSFVAIGGTATDEFVSTWSEGGMLATDIDSIRFYASTTNDSSTFVWIESIVAGTESYAYRSLSAGTTYWSAVKAIDDSGNVSYFSNIDSATTLSASGGYLAGANYVWNHLTETNNAVLTSWDDTTSALSIYSNGDPANTPYNLDSGVVWTAYDQYLRQAASFPAGLFDSALTIEMVVKVIRTDSSQCLFQARNASNIAMGIGIGATGIFVGNAYDATGGEDYTHNSTATTGWHHLVYTWNGTTTTAFYVDGNLVSDTGDLNQYDAISGDNRISMGKTGATNFPICAGTLTPYIAVYKRTLTAQQVSDNFNSTVIQNQIPAWAR